ncbi:MAG: colicin import rane protein [Sphingomonadales bacterium]|nr:colicin import rane protein [Sphingomonadales bacterium]
MAKPAKSIAEEQAESTDLVVMATVNPVEIFTSREQYSAFYEKIKAEVEKHTPDVSTERGRAAVRKLAFGVTKAKTTLEKAALALTEEWRQKTALVNTSRNEMVAELGALAKDVRRPLTEWEEAEAARIERCRATIDGFKQAAVVTLEDTSATVRERGKALWLVEVGDEFGEMADEASEAKSTAIATLHRALERLTQEEADRAELERLRAEQAEREEREARESEEREQAERDRIAAEEEEARRTAAAEAEARRIEEAAETAAANAREAAAREAREAEEARQAEHEAALAEERRQREQTERKATEEREAREAEDARRAAAEQQAREEQARRDADRKHRAEVIAAAAEAIVKVGVTKKLAENVVRAIIAGEVPAVTLRF